MVVTDTVATGHDHAVRRTVDVLGPGGRIAAILAFWGALATWVTVGGRRSRGSGGLGFGGSVAVLFVVTGLINAAVYTGARRLARGRRDASRGTTVALRRVSRC